MNKRAMSALLSSAVVATLASRAMAAPITQGDLLVYRVGTGAAALTSASTAVYLDEYTQTGALVQSIAMPTVASGSNNPLTASGSATSEGGLTMSFDGQSVVLAGYDAAPGTASIAGTATTAVPRDVAVVSLSGAIDTSTTTTAFSANNPRTVASPDGVNLYIAGANTGVVYTTKGASGAGTIIENTSTNNRQLGIFDSQLYVGTGSGSYRLATVGTGLPTTTGQTIAEVPGIAVGSGATLNSAVAGPYGFSLITLDGNAAPDVMYIADNSYNYSAGGVTSTSIGAIEKYVLTAGTWTAAGVIPLTGLTGLTTYPVAGSNGTQENVFVTTPSGIYQFTDAGGSISSDPLTQIVTAGTNEAFRGVVAVPEPTAAALLLVPAMGLLARRRRTAKI